MTMDLSWAGLIAIGGIVIATWRQIQAALKQISTYIIVQAQLDQKVARSVYVYCNEECSVTPFRSKSFLGIFKYVKGKARSQLLVYEDMTRNSLIFRRGWKFLVITQQKDAKKNNNEPETGIGYSAQNFTATIWCFRATWDIDAFIKEAVIYYNDKMRSFENEEWDWSERTRFTVTRFFGRGPRRNAASGASSPEPSSSYGLSNASLDVFDPRLGTCRPINFVSSEVVTDTAANMKAFDIYHFPDSIMRYVEEVRRWEKSEEWYKNKGIPWRRGFLLHGPAGSGKTSLLRSIAQDIDFPVFILDLASMSNEDLSIAWSNLDCWLPCMVVIEDIDAVFDGRENILGESGGGLTFDGLLNCISGLKVTDGVFLGITTNNIHKIDPAIAGNIIEDEMATRPGRIDRVIYLDAMEETCRRRLAARLLSEHPEEIEELVAKGEGMMAAQFTELCVRRCLDLHWGEIEKVEVKSLTEVPTG